MRISRGKKIISAESWEVQFSFGFSLFVFKLKTVHSITALTGTKENIDRQIALSLGRKEINDRQQDERGNVLLI